MPYIEKSARKILDEDIDVLVRSLDGSLWQFGEVNYVVYRIMLAWFKSKPRYRTICSIMGTLTCVSQEFYRKVASVYEDAAEKKNGEIT